MGFIVCPCALCTWFLFIATTYTFVLSCPLFMSSSFCPCCACCVDTRTVVLSLNLSFSRLPLLEVCVCNPWNHRDPFGLEFKLGSRGTGADLPIQSNEATAFRWMSGLINHLYLQALTWKLPLVPVSKNRTSTPAIASVCFLQMSTTAVILSIWFALRVPSARLRELWSFLIL